MFRKVARKTAAHNRPSCKELVVLAKARPNSPQPSNFLSSSLPEAKTDTSMSPITQVIGLMSLMHHEHSRNVGPRFSPEELHGIPPRSTIHIATP